MGPRGVLKAGALGAAAGLGAATPARALAFPRMNRTSKETTMTALRPFRVHVPDEALVDLRRRLAATRWPDRETVADRSQGNKLATMQALVQYWGSAYDWRKAEAKLNAYPQFLTAIDGLDIHFIQIRSRHPNALPLLMTHGWPGSAFEFLQAIGPLTDPPANGCPAGEAV